MKRQTIPTNYLKTICWFNNAIIDWASAGKQYTPDGKTDQLGENSFNFGDSAIISADGQYAFIYQKLGTKGLLLKNGALLREINRSYYCADVYEYPAAFVTLNSKTFLIHCPSEYCRLDFEEVETGQIITNSEGRNPADFFHSRLEISPNGKYLMSKGWFWHPWDAIKVFDIEECIQNPKLLDESEFYPNVGVEIATASFIDDHKVLLGSSDEEAINDELLKNLPPKHIAIWDINLNQISKPVKMNIEFGNLFAINDQYAWDIYGFPKIISLKTGEVVDEDRSLSSGLQNSSIIRNIEELPKVAFNQKTKQLAITNGDSIEIIGQ
ncbi:hypothetical protein J7E50_19710 [Pedobacter sp. ISL-68]|uniref:hypothetical protein n=1 Tax=unclassified Pedobacter TaxID=2628915 RepID=UPI001BEA23E2|nr:MULTISPECIES: hypothetical protein [unclassified Pedobacter]MBT2564421.1 hypothetical protein [Pedobacter sp. ISL-64]MBT2592453.1 hypothetical protein [Pedobacter sp. ISL-68]